MVLSAHSAARGPALAVRGRTHNRRIDHRWARWSRSPAEMTAVRPECHRPDRWNLERRRGQFRFAAETCSTHRRRSPSMRSRCWPMSADPKNPLRTEKRTLSYLHQRTRWFHVKHRVRSVKNHRGHCRTHAPSCPCLLGMGRHRECPPRHRRATQEVGREAVHRVRPPTGPHYRRAASLRLPGGACHACPPDRATCHEPHSSLKRCECDRPSECRRIALTHRPSDAWEESEPAPLTPRLTRLDPNHRRQQDPNPHLWKTDGSLAGRGIRRPR